MAATLAVGACRSSGEDTPPPPSAPASATATPAPSAELGLSPDAEPPRAPPRAAAVGRAPRTVTVESLDVAGRPRTYVLAAPGTIAPTRRYALALVLHPDGHDGPSMRAAFPLDDVSAEAAVVAYPTGTSGWNLYDPPSANEDFAFLVALVGALKARFEIDPARVFATGFSSGAFMVNQLGCREPTLFRAVATHSGGAPSEPQDATATRWDNGYTRCSRQTLGGGPAAMIVHGTADTDVTYDSGEFAASYWAYVTGCQPTRAADDSRPECSRYDGCPAGKPVVFCAIPALGHALWSEAAKATWQFFSTF